jgi:nucleotide-binding universal stress UspA family protein
MFPLQHVLCPIDFSDGSRRALDHAVALARHHEARVTVLYVHVMAVPLVSVGFTGMMAPVPLTAAERSTVLEQLGELAAPHRRAGTVIVPVVAEDLSVPRAIIQAAADRAADVIVLGTHGRSGFNRLVLGSVTTKVLRMAGRNVLVVPPGVRGATAFPSARILCAVDFSPSACRALEAAASLAQTSGTPLTVLHVVEPGAPELAVAGAAGHRQSRVELARASLDAALPPAIRAACVVDQLLRVGRPSHEILRVAAEQGADLIVMGAFGANAIEQALFGSTTDHVTRQAPCAVLVVPVL